MKKLVLTMASLVMLASMAFAQETPMLPESHGLTANQPAWGGSQTFNLVQGWNWWSTYINVSDIETLENALGENALQIKSTGDNVSYSNGSWVGYLNTLSNDQMYAIEMNNDATIQLRGSRASINDVEISVGNGWSWVGYPVDYTATVAYALSNFAALNEDVVKGIGDFASYNASTGEWIGYLTEMAPGNGYKIQSSTETEITFTYPNLAPSRSIASTVVEKKATEWRPVMASNPTNMNMIAIINLDNEELRGEDVEIGVFNGEICRGAICPLYVESFDRYMVFLTMYGEENEPFSFRLLNHETGEVYESNEVSVSYKADKVFGTLNSPFQLNFNTKTTAANSLNLFPNPVNHGEMVNMTLPGEGTKTVEVINVMGSTLKSMRMTQGSELSADMAPGIYTVKVTDADGHVYVDKLIVK